MAVFPFKSSRAFAEEASFRIVTLRITFTRRNQRFALVDVLTALSSLAPFVTIVTDAFWASAGVSTVGV